MTPEQLAAILDGLSKIFNTAVFGAIVAVIGSILTLLIQNSNERKRAQLQKQWEEKQAELRRTREIEDRNIDRKWRLTDREIDERKAQLLAHKQFVEGYLRTLLALSSHVFMRTTELGKLTREQLFAEYIQTIGMWAEAYQHIMAFGSPELVKAYESLMSILETDLFAVLRQPEDNKDKANKVPGKIAPACAQVVAIIENIILEKLRVEDCK